jgi:hypothetical protein
MPSYNDRFEHLLGYLGTALALATPDNPSMIHRANHMGREK